MKTSIIDSSRIKPEPGKLHYTRLYLDPLNPRLPKRSQSAKQDDICYTMYRNFSIEELADSMAQNGYFDEEPLIVIPNNLPKELDKIDSLMLKDNDAYLRFIRSDDTEFTVVEGNRRLTTIKLLLSPQLQVDFKIRTLPSLSSKVIEDISTLPVLIYPRREDVLAYLGVRHISGIKKWEPYAKARYIAAMVADRYSLDEIQNIVADRSNSARKFYLCYQLIEQMKLHYDTQLDFDNQNDFSYLFLAVGQTPIKKFLGLPLKLTEMDLNNPVPESQIKNLQLLFSFLYGDKRDKRVLSESRDITDKLTEVIANENSLQHLIETRDLEEAYGLSDGEENLVISNIKKAKRTLENSLKYAYKLKGNGDIINELRKCTEVLEVLKQVVES